MASIHGSQENLSFKEKRAISAFLSDLQKEEEETLLERLILFGSKARGESRQDSDVDLLAILRERKNEGRIYEEVARILSQHDVYLSVKALSQQEFKKLTELKTPFMKNIQKEGVVLWQKQ